MTSNTTIGSSRYLSDFDSVLKEFFDGTEWEERGTSNAGMMSIEVVARGINDSQRGETKDVGIRDGNTLDSFQGAQKGLIKSSWCESRSSQSIQGGIELTVHQWILITFLILATIDDFRQRDATKLRLFSAVLAFICSRHAGGSGCYFYLSYSVFLFCSIRTLDADVGQFKNCKINLFQIISN